MTYWRVLAALAVLELGFCLWFRPPAPQPVAVVHAAQAPAPIASPLPVIQRTRCRHTTSRLGNEPEWVTTDTCTTIEVLDGP